MDAKEQQALFHQCAGTHAGIVWRIARSFADGDGVDDLVQDIWVQVWTSLPRFAGRSRLSTWLYQVALRTALTAQRRHARHQAEPLDQEPVDRRRDPTAERDLKRMLEETLKRFPASDRALLLLWLEDLSYREMGDILGLSETNVGARLSRLKSRLRSHLEPYRHELR